MNTSTAVGPRTNQQLEAFLGSIQLADSAFPSGRYTLSHGLESYAQSGRLTTDNLEALLADYIRHGAGPSDGVALACAHRAASTGSLTPAVQADGRLTAVKLPREARTASTRTGRQVLALARDIFGGDTLRSYGMRVDEERAAGNYAVAVGLVTAFLDVPREQAVAGELYSWTTSALSAALRLGITEHRTVQTVLHRLKPVIAEVVDDNSGKEVGDISSCTPLADVMAMRHERAETRLFMS